MNDELARHRHLGPDAEVGCELFCSTAALLSLTLRNCLRWHAGLLQVGRMKTVLRETTSLVLDVFGEKAFHQHLGKKKPTDERGYNQALPPILYDMLMLTMARYGEDQQQRIVSRTLLYPHPLRHP
jgi:hypothetical protein